MFHGHNKVDYFVFLLFSAFWFVAKLSHIVKTEKMGGGFVQLSRPDTVKNILLRAKLTKY